MAVFDEKEDVYECIHCKGKSHIVTLKESDKATVPTIEFCPFCGMSNEYKIELEGRDELLSSI
ncbi:hypothetical protein CEE37_13765 [candidate division LCP-89 bacterium B3_LCP]|uniref:Uncharacterized protein n=1 Tax=candidate division LCP-89 bacterium B3_LCP TaxID=2012998 RepID=A0A532URJ7_UNCL8|nr:MAG: hypothetical protein CEE37_13765 [candidate division LCP-89 bacterium B3_LCP]